MKVLIDVGNSNTLFKIYDNDILIKSIKTITYKNNIVDKFYPFLDQELLEHNITEGAMSSVVPDVTEVICKYFKDKYNFDILNVNNDLKVNLNIKIKEPQTLGADLLCDIVGARVITKEPYLVVDLGTCTKFLIVDNNNDYLGGAIMPGVVASLDSMFNNAALLNKFDLELPTSVIGDDTFSCISSGVYYGTASTVDGMIEKYEKELGYKLTVILTGGISQFIKDLIHHEFIYCEDLIFKGLIELEKLNK